jgi:hypothetical protein
MEPKNLIVTLSSFDHLRSFVAVMAPWKFLGDVVDVAMAPGGLAVHITFTMTRDLPDEVAEYMAPGHGGGPEKYSFYIDIDDDLGD